jgi:UDP-N-acetylmuramoyl-tripeptide--D-alanyl-D-alanine ligase
LSLYFERLLISFMPNISKGRFEYWLRQVVISKIVQRVHPLLDIAAFIWRRLLFRTTFIGVTGSLGKTTAKECIADILASAGPTFRSYRNQGGPAMVSINLLRVRPWHRFAVLEVAVGEPNSMRRPARLLRPDVAVLLNVKRTHTKAFRDLEEHAAEKKVLLEALRPDGLAVMNADDLRVKRIAGEIGRRAVFFGMTPDAEYRAEQISGSWPQRLSFVVRCKSTAEAVETQLVGKHWLSSALAAIATTHSLGIELGQITKVLSDTPPFPGRLQPVQVPSGAIFLRDDYSASIDTMEASLRVLEEASAPRRLLVITDISDFGLNRAQRLKHLANQCHRVAEVLVLVGSMAKYGARRAVEAGMEPAHVHAFPTMRSAAEFLRTELKLDDLVLLKGRTTDHAARIFFAQLGPVGCWKEYCSKRMLCDICWELDITPDQCRKGNIIYPSTSLPKVASSS